TTTAAFVPATALAAQLGADLDVLFVVHPRQDRPRERGSMTPPYYLDRPYYDWPEWRARVATWMRCHCANVPRETAIHTHVVTAKDRAGVGEAIAEFASERGED